MEASIACRCAGSSSIFFGRRIAGLKGSLLDGAWLANHVFAIGDSWILVGGELRGPRLEAHGTFLVLDLPKQWAIEQGLQIASSSEAQALAFESLESMHEVEVIKLSRRLDRIADSGAGIA